MRRQQPPHAATSWRGNGERRGAANVEKLLVSNVVGRTNRVAHSRDTRYVAALSLRAIGSAGNEGDHAPDTQ